MQRSLTLLLSVLACSLASELSRCCNAGARHFKLKSSCSDIRVDSSGVMCTRASSICCLRALLDRSCDHGTTMAQEQEYCPTNMNQIGGGVRKECCDCCLLAKDLLRHDQACLPPSGFSAPCLRSFNKCCARQSDIDFPSPLEITGRPDSLLGTNCSNAKCEQLCSMRADAVECSCTPGYDLASDGFSCIDQDECLPSMDRLMPCNDDETCENIPGGYRCHKRDASMLSDGTSPFHVSEESLGDGIGEGSASANELHCPSGWKPNDLGSCVDVDECNLGTHDCGPSYQCRNTQGSYRCDPKKCGPGEQINPRTGLCTSLDCPIGYRPSEGRCEDVNECEIPGRCRPFEECINTPGSYRCQEMGNPCTQGYRMDHDTGFCVDINECLEGSHSCGEQQCINLQGSFKCRCSAGFDFNETSMRCEDIDECAKFAGHVCSLHATCENTYGSFRCHCKPGFKLAADGRNCDDIDECAMGIARCAQKCVNIPGSYQCICERGYQLAADEATCEDIDECALWAGSGDDWCMGGCKNTPGSYRCQCPFGYEIQDDGRTCKDIDECAKGSCQGHDNICVNTLGHYKCHRIECPPNYVHDKNYKNRCNRARRACDGLSEAVCKNTPVHISWQYIAIPRYVPISSQRTSITLFTIKGPSSTSSSVQFELNLKRSFPEISSVLPAVRSNFLLQKGIDRNSAVISLRDSLDGPQEIELELVLRLTIDGVFQGKFIANLVIYVAAYKRQRSSPVTFL